MADGFNRGSVGDKLRSESVIDDFDEIETHFVNHFATVECQLFHFWSVCDKDGALCEHGRVVSHTNANVHLSDHSDDMFGGCDVNMIDDNSSATIAAIAGSTV